jgi:CAAX protease family protein
MTLDWQRESAAGRQTIQPPRQPAAVILSVATFSPGHGYEGSAGVITVGAMGGVFAVIYLWRRSLVAPIAMHFPQDFISITLLPLTGLH